MQPAPLPAPQVCPSLDVLDDLELLRMGALGPSGAVTVPVSRADAEASLLAGGLDVVDPEGSPLAHFGPAESGGESSFFVTGTPVWLGLPSSRPYERLYLSPAASRAAVSCDAVTVLVDRPITDGDLPTIVRDVQGREVVFLVLTGPSMSPQAQALRSTRSAIEAVRRLPDATVVTVPLSTARAGKDPEMVSQVVSAYAPGIVMELPPSATADPEPPRGLVLFFTGLSGSGKSTVARAVRDAIIESQDRPLTLLDGDVVRRNLSAGLSFSPADRETNIRRIGWVAAEIGLHGGTAICSPIAPYQATRAEVRELVTQRGADFVLVHVSTPVEECERRDRKGLYARARAGEIADFTGVSAPYEEPPDADLTLDTSTMSIAEARDAVLTLLQSRGHLDDADGAGP